MEKLITLARKLSKSKGINKTYLPQVHIYHNDAHTERVPLLYNQGILFMIKGEKQIYTETHDFAYGQEKFLVITVPMPLECRCLESKDNEVIGLALNIEIPLLNELINMMEESNTMAQIDKCNKDNSLYTSEYNENIIDALARLLECLQDPLEAKVLGLNIVKEIIFNLLKQKEAAPLYALATKSTNLSKIEYALKDVQKNYNKNFDVEGLAKSVNMSVSAFHQNFKNVTSSSPIQYIKKLRLNKAREFLINNQVSVNEAAINVGYESVSQFNREFKRYFGVTPGSLNR